MNPVIEVVGLPGVGKSSACIALLARVDGAEPSWVSARRIRIRKSLLPKLLLPVTLLRYRRVFRAQRPQNGKSWPRTRAALRFFRRRSRGLRRAKNPLVSTMFLLSTSVTEMGLARVESWLRRRTLIVDEGFVHRALGVWLRSDPTVREAALAAYLDTIPIGSACILLRCEPDTAVARALTRKRGIPIAARRTARALDNGSGTEAAISATYHDQAGIFELESLRARVAMQDVDAKGTPEEIAEQIENSLRRLGVDRPLLIFQRT